MEKIRVKLPHIEAILVDNSDLVRVGSRIIGECILSDDYEELVDENYLYGEFCELAADLEVQDMQYLPEIYDESLRTFTELKKSL